MLFATEEMERAADTEKKLQGDPVFTVLLFAEKSACEFLERRDAIEGFGNPEEQL